MSDKINIQTGSFASLLTVAFIVLKLTGYINWSWWWVLSPLWISLGLFFGILAVISIILIIIAFLQK